MANGRSLGVRVRARRDGSVGIRAGLQGPGRTRPGRDACERSKSIMNYTILSPEQVALLLKSIPGGVGFLRLVQQGEWKAYFCPSCGIFYDICRNDVRNEGICKYCRWDEDAAIQAEFDRWLSTQPICPFCDEPD